MRLTEIVAARLMKNRARHIVYTTRGADTGNPALLYVARLEADLLQSSERDWRTILTTWRRHEEQRLLLAIQSGRTRARQDACLSYDDQVTATALYRYFDALRPRDLLPERTP